MARHIGLLIVGGVAVAGLGRLVPSAPPSAPPLPPVVRTAATAPLTAPPTVTSAPMAAPALPPTTPVLPPPPAKSAPLRPADARAPPAFAPPPSTLFVRGERVALRAAPRADGAILDRLNAGQSVERLGAEGAWVRVRHPTTQREGWVSERRLAATPPEPPAPAPPPPAAPSGTTKAVALTAAAIAALLVAESVAQYRATRPCACPYHATRTGRSCGSNSAYARPGGAKPLCYPSDVTPAMIAAFRAR